MVRITVDFKLWKVAREHLDEDEERVGFFLATWSPDEHDFTVQIFEDVELDQVLGLDDEFSLVLEPSCTWGRFDATRGFTLEAERPVDPGDHGKRGCAARLSAQRGRWMLRLIVRTTHETESPKRALRVSSEGFCCGQ